MFKVQDLSGVFSVEVIAALIKNIHLDKLRLLMRSYFVTTSLAQELKTICANTAKITLLYSKSTSS